LKPLTKPKKYDSDFWLQNGGKLLMTPAVFSFDTVFIPSILLQLLWLEKLQQHLI